jgi:hypothetical protein
MEFKVWLPDSLGKVRDPTYRERMGIADVAFKHTGLSQRIAQPTKTEAATQRNKAARLAKRLRRFDFFDEIPHTLGNLVSPNKSQKGGIS